jgi:hypothetical protein
MSADELLRRWNRVVDEVEHGYRASIADYANDLMKRDSVQQLIDAALPPGRAAQLEADARALDERFRQATRSSQLPVFLRPRSEHWWWWYRIPILLSDGLAQQLAEEGHRVDRSGKARRK